MVNWLYSQYSATDHLLKLSVVYVGLLRAVCVRVVLFSFQVVFLSLYCSQLAASLVTVAQLYITALSTGN